MSSNRKKAATNVFIVRAKRVSADQMNRTGTMITPSNIRRMVMVFSLRLLIKAHRAEGIEHREMKRAASNWQQAACN
jgi:hypothetical protein